MEQSTEQQAPSTEEQKPVMLKIHATMPKVSATESLVSFRRKDTAKNPVEEKDKFRGVLVVPPYVLPQTSEALHEVFAQAIQDAFFDAAGSILRAFCDATPTATEIDAAHFAFDKIVAKMAEQQSSMRLNGETILNWFDASQTSKDAATRYGGDKDKRFISLREKYGALASNNPGGIPPKVAEKMLAYISPDDADNPIVKTLAKKLEKLSVEVADDL